MCIVMNVCCRHMCCSCCLDNLSLFISSHQSFVVYRALYDVFNFEGPCLVPSMGAVLRCGAIFVEIAFLFGGIAVLHERML